MWEDYKCASEGGFMTENVVDKEVMEVIRANYSGAFPAAQKVMDYVMRHPQEVVSFNVSELAKASGTSDASVVRVCHNLGYEGYSQFRLTLARDLGKKELSDKSASEYDDPVKEMFAEFSKSLMDVADSLNKKTVRKCVELIKNASCVHVIAVGNTANISQYMGFRLERLGIKSTHYSDQVYFLNQLDFADAKDIVIAITKSGDSPAVIDGMKLAKEKKLKVILITSAPSSKAGKMADHILLSSGQPVIGNTFKTYSYLTEMAVADALLSFVVNDELL